VPAPDFFPPDQLYAVFRQHPIIVTDSRRVIPGCIYFALKGERFDGNRFAPQAIADGASYAVIDDPSVGTDPPYLLVQDTLRTLQELGRLHRRQFDCPVLAITGSNGKTTTKELVFSVLASHYETHATTGNLNNHIGVPLTLLAMPPNTEIAVIEMGANHPGEIAELCRIAEPTHGIITNVGKAHLEGFGSFEGVKQTKAELYRFVESQQGCVFVNGDEPFLDAMAGPYQRKLVYRQTALLAADQPYAFLCQREEPFLRVAFLDANGTVLTADTHLFGRHNFQNVMTAIAVGKYFKVPDTRIADSLSAYIPNNNRSQWVSFHDNTFLMDAYNANPTSMRHALLAFAKVKADRKVAILGAMLELGSYAPLEHLDIARLASSLGFHQVLFVGEGFRQAALELQAPFFQNTADLAHWFRQQHFKETSFLVKGSRSIGLERMLDLP
jgi:UDP-N-acetylmuramoyl-tripeptide--D-alanyl-D-alanine ligase